MTRKLYVPANLYLSISETVEEAFKNDHNMIIEEFDFYQQLPPRVQTNLINLIFEDFRQNFRHFFDPCDTGFINEVIIRLYSRRYQRPTSGRNRLVKPQYKMTEIFFTMEGSFGLYHPTLKIKGKSAIEQAAVIFPRFNVFGDYQLLFDLEPMAEFCTFVPGATTTKDILKELGDDGNVEEYRVMCLKEEDF